MVQALAVVHNFIIIYDPRDGVAEEEDLEQWPEVIMPSWGDLRHAINRQERLAAADRRDEIANTMWDGYMRYRDNLE